MDENTASIVVIILCISGPLFFITTVILSIVLLFNYTTKKSLREEHEQARQERKIFSEQKQKLDLRIRELETAKQTLEFNLRDMEQRISTLSSNALSEYWLRWCNEVANANYNSEVEVEIKFIYLFLRFLGYSINDLRTRVSVEVPVGRQKVIGIADWVAYNFQQRRPFLVVEAKEPNQQLNNGVKDQARSYAFALNAQYYILTNGKEIIIFERKVDEDICIININVKDLQYHWKQIEQLLSKR